MNPLDLYCGSLIWRPDVRIESIAGETLVVAPTSLPIVTAEFIDGDPTGAQYTITNGALSVHFITPGPYGFRVGLLGGVLHRDCRFLCFERACFDAVPEAQRSGRSALRSSLERRLVLRSVAVHEPNATGQFDDHARDVIANYGGQGAVETFKA